MLTIADVYEKNFPKIHLSASKKWADCSDTQEKIKSIWAVDWPKKTCS